MILTNHFRLEWSIRAQSVFSMSRKALEPRSPNIWLPTSSQNRAILPTKMATISAIIEFRRNILTGALSNRCAKRWKTRRKVSKSSLFWENQFRAESATLISSNEIAAGHRNCLSASVWKNFLEISIWWCKSEDFGKMDRRVLVGSGKGLKSYLSKK